VLQYDKSFFAMFFVYKSVKKDGTHSSGTIEANDKFAVYKKLHEEGNTVLSVTEEGKKSSLKNFLNFSFGGAKMADRIMFAKNLSAMLKAGLPLARALTVLERQMTGKSWKPIFVSLSESLSKGTNFSAALALFPKTFSSLFVSMVAAGEESGSLSQSLSIVGEQLEKSYNLQKKVRGAMMYPGIILSVMVIIGIMMLVFVIPKLTATFKEFNTELPFATRLVIWVSDFFEAHYIIVVLALLTAVISTYIFSKTATGKRVIGRLVLKLPIIGNIAKEINSARMSRTFSSLLSSGVEVVTAIKITADVVQNVHYKEMLKVTAENIQKGSTLQSLFMPRSDLYPSFVSEMIGVGEETGTLSKTLFEVAIFYENEVDQKTKDMSTIIEPFLMVFIGVGVGFFALAMISPIYSLSDKIS
jgi:type II secretory pathway component PulF